MVSAIDSVARSKIYKLYNRLWNGCRTYRITDHTIGIDKGIASTSDLTELMVVSSPLTLNILRNGVNGLDTGVAANSKWYYVYLIYNPSTLVTAGLISTSATYGGLTKPSGYTKFRKMPFAIRRENDAFLNIDTFGWPRPVYSYVGFEHSATFQVLSNGVATSFTAVDCSALAPPESQMVQVDFVPEYVSGAATLRVRTKSGGAPTGRNVITTASGQPVVTVPMRMGTNTTQQFDYRWTGAGSKVSVYLQEYHWIQEL